MFPKKGNLFPGRSDRKGASQTYPALIAGALRRELGNSHLATKTVTRWTGASERTVKHWFAGRHGPGGAHLVALMRESESVFETVLVAADRGDAALAARILGAHASLVEAMSLLEQMSFRPSALSPMQSECAEPAEVRGAEDRSDVRTNVRNPGTGSAAHSGTFNARQRWYLGTLATGRDVRADDIRRYWGVSEKTARRDLATLKACGKIEYYGSHKKGRYRLLP